MLHAANSTCHCHGEYVYAEALQRINKLYKLSAGKFVQPDILMSRLLSLPRGFDHVVETIESINGMRAGWSSKGPSP